MAKWWAQLSGPKSRVLSGQVQHTAYTVSQPNSMCSHWHWGFLREKKGFCNLDFSEIAWSFSAEVSERLIHLRYKQLLQPEAFTTITVFAAVILIPWGFAGRNMKLFPHPPCPTLSWSLAFSIPIITFGFSRHLPSSATDAGWSPHTSL